MKTLIVAKAHMSQGACIGGVTITGQNVRLLLPGTFAPHPANTPYAVGDVWELELGPAPAIKLPHGEDVVVLRGRKLYTADNLLTRIRKLAHPWQGGLTTLFAGYLQTAANGSTYIAQSSGLPPMSVGFWLADKPLQRQIDGRKTRYLYTDDRGRSHTFPYIGFAPSLPTIPAGTLLRLSLARWWEPPDHTCEPRCYMQLSGWFIEETQGSTATMQGTGAESPTRTGAEPAKVTTMKLTQGNNAAAGMEPTPVEILNTDLLPDDPFGDDWSQMLDVWTGDAAATLSAPSPPPALSPALTPSPPPVDQSQVEDLSHQHLKTIFGYDSFRPLQAQIIRQVLSGQDTLVIMPTGGGKSLCYQIPGLIFNGLSVVVSPLIALMKDQVDQLREAGVAAAYLNSSLPRQEYNNIVGQVHRRQLKLLYLAPETLVKSDMIELLTRVPVAAFVVDEAHCISQWGHDFRPEYRQILAVRRHFPHAVTLALTATATPRVQHDIKETLGLREGQSFIASFNRENLFLAVTPKTNPLQQTLDFLEAHQGQSGIIYCFSRRQVDELTGFLASKGYNVRPYHAGLSAAEREANQTAFSRDDVPLMVATIAFGLGIDKPNIRFILHYDLPENLEGYYQQVGRAGRDGQPSDCLLLFSRSDMSKIGHFIREKAAHEQTGAWHRLETMANFAETTKCRRVPLLAYFGEESETETCGGCDNCAAATPTEQVDLTQQAQKFLSCVKRTGEIFGLNHIIDVLRGSKAKEVIERQHDQLSTYGIGREFSKKQWLHLAQQFLRLGLLQQDAQYGSLKMTPEGYAVLKGQTVWGTFMAGEQREWLRSRQEPPAYDSELFAHLHQQRKKMADTASLPPYVIFPDQTLQEMATYFPQSETALLTIYGVGQAKLAKYGAAFLHTIRAYCQSKGLKEKVPVAAAPSARGQAKVGERTVQVVDLLHQGKTIEEIAAAFNVTSRTVINHLFKGYEAGYQLRTEGLRQYSQLPPEYQEAVLQAFATLGADFLRPIFDHFQETIPFDELHILRLVYLSQQKQAG